jgi:hypothetical protein
LRTLSSSVTCGRLMLFSAFISSTNKTDCHNITEILLKVVLNTTTLTPLSSLLSGSFISHKPHGRFKVNLKEMLLWWIWTFYMILFHLEIQDGF